MPKLHRLPLAVLILSLPAAVVQAAEEAAQPNVLLIMTDDQGYGDLSLHGNDQVQTPVLDRLAREGAQAERFFVSPVCAPTRAALLAGRYPLRTGVHGVTRAEETMRSGEVTLAELFRAGGYATGCFGKWHNGAHYPYHPNGQGFDTFFGFCAGHWNNYFDTTLEHNGRPVATEGYITDVLTGAAIEFIEEHKQQPWLCYVPYNAPHSPWQVPRAYFDRAKARGLDDKTACAYAMCENLDDNIGRLLDRLEKLHLAENTIVLFLTDNGPNSDRFNGNMRGRKGSVHEGGVRVPLFVRWTGRIKPGTVIEPIAAHIDLLPTLAELCTIAADKTLPLDGKSIAPLLLQETANWPDRMLFTARSAARGAVRTQKWRAVREGRPWQLYDMQQDPEQKNNVAAEHPELVKRFAAAFEEHYADVTREGLTRLPTPVGYPERPQVTLPGHEAELVPGKGKGFRYDGPSGWANDWIARWTDRSAYPQWPLKVIRPGRYEIALRYVCAEQNLGAKIEVQVAGSSVGGRITRAHNPRPLPSPDRVPRKEVYEKTWARLALGTVQLEPGSYHLKVRALEKPGDTVMDLKAVEVRGPIRE